MIGVFTLDLNRIVWGKLDRSMAILLVCSLFIKIVLVSQSEIINPDGIRYLNSAHELFRGNIAAAFSHDKMLGFTFLLGLSHLFISDWHLAGKILSSIALVLATIPLYLITQEIFSRRAAFCTALVFTFASSINGKCATVIKDPSFLFLIILSLWLLLAAQKESRWVLSLFAGVIACTSVLIRPEGIVFILIVFLSLSVLVLFAGDNRTVVLKSLLAFGSLPVGSVFAVAILFALGALPQETLSVIYAKFAHYFRTDQMQTYMSIYKHLASVEGNFPGGESAHDFFEYARYNIYLIYLIGMMQTFLGAVSPLLILPLFVGLKLRDRCSNVLFLFLSVLVGFLVMDYLFLMTWNFIAGRYLLVPVVLSYVLIGHGMDRMITPMNNSRFRNVLFSVAIILCFVFPLGRAFYKTTQQKSEIKIAGTWLRENRDLLQSRLIVNDERIAYYAGLLRGSYDTFKRVDINRFEKRALAKDSDILVVYLNDRDVDKLPAFKEFALVESISGRGKVAMIYERKNNG